MRWGWQEQRAWTKLDVSTPTSFGSQAIDVPPYCTAFGKVRSRAEAPLERRHHEGLEQCEGGSDGDGLSACKAGGGDNRPTPAL